MMEQWDFFGLTLRDIDGHLGCVSHAILSNGSEYNGYLYSVDPETRTLLMLVQNQGEADNGQDQNTSDMKWKMVAIRQSSLRTLKFTESAPSLPLEEMDVFAHISKMQFGVTEVKTRKEALVKLLQSKRIPLETSEEDMIIHIMNCAHVRPPYLLTTIDCNNEVIRERIKGMMKELL